jgi:phosphate-selective porin OprO/OprP
MARSRTLALAALVGLVVALPVPVGAQDTQKPAPPDSSPREEPPTTGIYWRNRPSIQLGPHVRLDLRLKLAYDWRRFDPQIDELPDDWRFRRAGINGEIGEDIEFQIERDVNRLGRWRDVYVNWGKFRQLEVTAGRFKVPFGHEELIGIADVDFAFRSLASTTIPPARDRGVMLHGRFLQRGFTYQIGVFDDDGDNGRLQEEQFSVTGEVGEVGPSVAGRVTATPLRPLAETFGTLRIGAAYGSVEMPEGLNSLRGETVYGTEEFFEPVYIKGKRSRMGLEVNYTPGPVGLTAEWMRAREQRRNQGLGDADLSDVLTTGWYTSATWLVTGESKEDFNNPRRPLFNGGIGAFELAVRYEVLQFESEEKVGPAFRNPRAEHILSNSDRALTLGINWFVNRWVRVTANVIREEFEDAARTPLPGTTEFRSGVARLQLVF